MNPQDLKDFIRNRVQPVLAAQQELQTIIAAAAAAEQLADDMIRYGSPSALSAKLWTSLSDALKETQAAIDIFLATSDVGPTTP